MNIPNLECSLAAPTARERCIAVLSYAGALYRQLRPRGKKIQQHHRQTIASQNGGLHHA